MGKAGCKYCGSERCTERCGAVVIRCLDEYLPPTPVDMVIQPKNRGPQRRRQRSKKAPRRW